MIGGGFGMFPIPNQPKGKAAVLWKHYCLNKGDWGNNIWSLGLLLTGIKTFAKVGRPSGCAGRIKFAVMSGQNGDVKSDASCKESATLFAL